MFPPNLVRDLANVLQHPKPSSSPDTPAVAGTLTFQSGASCVLLPEYNSASYVLCSLGAPQRSLGDLLKKEMSMYKRIEQCRSDHPGRDAVRHLLDSFQVKDPDGDHLILAHDPLGRSIQTVITCNNPRALPPSGVRFVLKELLLALDYLHRECNIIHTDIKADIMFSISDTSVFTDFEEAGIQEPSPRKEVDDRAIYLSRILKRTGTIGPVVLCDFGAAVFGDTEHREVVQPPVYRAPEVILEAPWDHKIDVWMLGCMTWDILEGFRLFNGIDPEHHAYRRRTHLAELIALLGPPPKELIARGNLGSKFFSDEGEFTGGVGVPGPVSLESLEGLLAGEEKRRFLEFMRKMLQWDPSSRSTAAELQEDPWLQEGE
ncbi:kinase-like domain-containing protein [Microdochium trichocladiopsis]|uniref:Kinase-like domain-containing protein n=1 Tax=Microdochium trichocladiopsis TaxID=1682393 RepID=A0A9P8XPQ8_9PEZI|nr:kinase-like domain-containing protein [Microdochium trichocladiopsis]KAH7009457.1 kinase-like domain-containing protein [Microdochium trichocladiopsis]